MCEIVEVYRADGKRIEALRKERDEYHDKWRSWMADSIKTEGDLTRYRAVMEQAVEVLKNAPAYPGRNRTLIALREALRGE